MAGDVVTADEVDISFLEYRQILKGSAKTRIPEGRRPKQFTLAIDQEGGRAFWGQKDGVAYIELSKLLCIQGEVAEARVIPCKEPPTSLFIRDKFLVVVSGPAASIYSLSDLSSEMAELNDCRQVACSREYLVCLRENDPQLVCHKLSNAREKSLKESSYKFLTASEHSDSIWGIDVGRRLVEELQLPLLEVKRSVAIPEDFEYKSGGISMHVASPNFLALGYQSNVIVLQLLNNGKPRWTWVKNPARGSGAGTITFSSISDWSLAELQSLLIVADSTATEVVCGGVGRDGEGYHSFFLASEEGLVELPMDPSGEDTFPVAMALDYTSSELVDPTNPEDPMLPPQPTLWIISSEARFLPFRVVKNNQATPHPMMKNKIKPGASLIPPELLSTKTQMPPSLEDVSGEAFDLPGADQSAESTLFPELSVLTEDLGQLNNAVAAEFSQLYEAFQNDLTQLRSLGEVLNSRVLKGRDKLDSLHATSTAISRLSLDLDRELQQLPGEETRLLDILRSTSQSYADANMIAKGRDFAEELGEMLDRVSLAIDKAEVLTIEAAALPNSADRRQFVRERVLPQLEESLEKLTPCLKIIKTEAIPASHSGAQRSSNWSKLHALLRARSADAVVSTDKRRANLAKEQDKVEIGCRPIPAPLSLPRVDLHPIKSSKLPQTSLLSRVPQSISLTSDTKVAAVKTDLKPTASPLTVFPATEKPLTRQSPSSNPAPFKLGPAANVPEMTTKGAVVWTDRAKASGEWSAPRSLEGPILAVPPIVEPVKSPQLTTLKASPGLFSFSFTTTQQSPKSVSPLNIDQGQRDNSSGTEANGQSSLDASTTSEATKSPKLTLGSLEKSVELDAKSLKVHSPTPKGPKPIRSSIEPGPDASSSQESGGLTSKGQTSASDSTTTLGTLGTLSLETQQAPGEKPESSKVTNKTVPSLFGVPQIVASVASTAAGSTQPIAISTSAFDFRPSTLERVAPPPTTSIFSGTGSEGSSAFATPLASPAPPPPSAGSLGFASLQSLGMPSSGGIVTLTPAFGAPSSFGALGGSQQQSAFGSAPVSGGGAGVPAFGQSSSFGLAAPPQPASSMAGFSAFASGSAFSAFTGSTAPEGASIFGSSSSSAQRDERKKDEGKLSFTQFRT